MGSRRTRVGPARRVAMALLAGVMATAVPGFAPPASAQEQVAGEVGWARPPDLPSGTGPPGDGGGKPSKNYEKETACVQRDLDDNVDLLNKPWGQQYLQIEQAQSLARAATGSAGKYENGQPVKVAVIDTGVNRHPYLGDRLEPGGDYVAETDKGPGLEDCDGHGTEVAGIIAAKPTDPGIGFTGVAPDARIVSIRQSSQNYVEQEETSTPAPPPEGGQPPAEGDQPPSEGQPPAEGGESSELPPEEGRQGLRGTGPAQEGPTRQLNDGKTAGDVESLAKAVVRAANTADVKVMNVSINNCRPATGQISPQEQQLQAAIRYAVEDKDIVVVTAAGNTSESCKQNNQADPNKPTSIVSPPWFADNVLSVAAIDHTGGIAPFSVTGPWVSVAAPGTHIISLDPAENSDKLANRMTEGGGEPMPIQGTSFAAPYVAGVAALVRTAYPDLNAREVMRRLTSTAQHPAAPGGRDNFVGYGVINPVAALTAMVPEEEGIQPAGAKQIPSDMPPPNAPDPTPMIVAFAGAGGGLAALLIALFVVHTIRRNRKDTPLPPTHP